MENSKNLLEAILFASTEPLSAQQLYERVPEGTDVGALLQELKKDYEARGIRLMQMDNTFAFRTAPDLANDLQFERTETRKLSKAALETLAIVAYHQPVTRAEIENIRGVATNKGTLDVLMECGWVKPGKRREAPGKPLTWITTNNFLDYFGLESTMALPGLDEMKATGLLDRRPAIDTVPDMFSKEETHEEDEMEQD
jgi:segregation and condensation protein B